MTEALSLFLTTIDNLTHSNHRTSTQLCQRKDISDFSVLWAWYMFPLMLCCLLTGLYWCTYVLSILSIHHIHTPHSLIPRQKLHAQFQMFSFMLIHKTLGAFTMHRLCSIWGRHVWSNTQYSSRCLLFQQL